MNHTSVFTFFKMGTQIGACECWMKHCLGNYKIKLKEKTPQYLLSYK